MSVKSRGTAEKSGTNGAAVGLAVEGRDPWSCLHLIDRLEVGPVQIEPNRLTVPHRVVQGDRTDETQLIYRYAENVYDPADPGTLDLANMQAAQIAFNYGLFCDEIVFHGGHDEADRRFIEQMMENTSREIAVKQFLQPNPFLRGPAAELRAAPADSLQRERWTHARLRFEPAGGENGGSRSRRSPWQTDPNRYAVLSSGGKDSLVSLGLLREAGLEAHPLFINESGNHWLTALNAYRYLAEQHLGTSRVWTNSDRVFAWFVRHLPCVRPDFLDVRADEYPIRLWTVAVFLFGALPLLRARGIGRLVIGDEFDTTRRATHRGISHYDGLYDQSFYFDRALSRYFHRKGWGVQQFSVLRPLSELFIQKMLAARYPDLLVHQVSCHAAHVEADGRVHPCGRCEKCRRIVGMLVAEGVDPALCGYRPEQVAACLQALATAGVHQEAECAEHVLHLLAGLGLLPSPTLAVRGRGPRARAHPEVVKLRFDQEHSPLDEIPSDLREKLLRIYLEHADGVVRRAGGAWTEMNLTEALGASQEPVGSS
jgi:hypothetical protein